MFLKFHFEFSDLNANTIRTLIPSYIDLEPKCVTLILETTRDKVTIKNVKVSDRQY